MVSAEISPFRERLDILAARLSNMGNNTLGNFYTSLADKADGHRRARQEVYSQILEATVKAISEPGADYRQLLGDAEDAIGVTIIDRHGFLRDVFVGTLDAMKERYQQQPR